MEEKARNSEQNCPISGKVMQPFGNDPFLTLVPSRDIGHLGSMEKRLIDQIPERGTWQAIQGQKHRGLGRRTRNRDYGQGRGQVHDRPESDG